MPRIPQLLFVGLVGLTVLSPAPTGATQVKLLTYNNGLGNAVSAGHRITLTVGEPLAGRTNPWPDRSRMYFGFWEILNRYQSVSLVGDETPALVTRLFRSYPNPFNPSTLVSFTLAQASEVRIDVFDLMGWKVDTILAAFKPSGSYSITYQPTNLASGAYVILMRAGSFRTTQRVMLIK